MDLTLYDVIIGPVVTDKAYRLNRKNNTLSLYVNMHANKSMIKQAVKKLFNVDVHDVRVQVRKGKSKQVGRKTIQRSSKKKAIISLAPGQSLDLFGQGGTGGLPEKQTTT